MLLLLHGECQLAGGRLDLVLRLHVRHPLGAEPIDGGDDVTLSQAAAHRLAPWGYLRRGQGGACHTQIPKETNKQLEEVCSHTNTSKCYWLRGIRMNSLVV